MMDTKHGGLYASILMDVYFLATIKKCLPIIFHRNGNLKYQGSKGSGIGLVLPMAYFIPVLARGVEPLTY
jgi:hypothetical protein